MKFSFVFSAALITAFFSCSDPIDPAPVVVIDGKLLVNTKGWVVISSVKDDGNTKKDLYSQYATCVADNIYTFQVDGQYIIDEGDKKCELTDPQEKESGEWKLNGSSLTLIPDGDLLYQFTISSLTTDKLVFTYLEMGTNGIVANVTTITLHPKPGI